MRSEVRANEARLPAERGRRADAIDAVLAAARSGTGGLLPVEGPR